MSWLRVCEITLHHILQVRRLEAVTEEARRAAAEMLRMEREEV